MKLGELTLEVKHCTLFPGCSATLTTKLSALQNNHVCVENSMRQNCPVCFEYLFDSVRPTAVLPCGHTIHTDCLREMERNRSACISSLELEDFPQIDKPAALATGHLICQCESSL